MKAARDDARTRQARRQELMGVLVFPGNGIQENLADKASRLGIPVMKFEKGA